ncbi:MAG: response regulator [Acidobacteriota bacterium]
MMASGDASDLLQQGIQLARGGDKAAAREVFERLAVAQPDHETVWLWLSSVAPDAAESARYLESALRVDPTNKQARDWLARLESVSTAQRPTEARKTSFRCPLCEQSFTAEPERCARCRSHLDLFNIEAFFQSSTADIELVGRAIALTQVDSRLEAKERHRLLSLAYLNLKRFQKALSQLSALAALSPEDSRLREAVEALTERLEREPLETIEVAPSKMQRSDVETTRVDVAELVEEAEDPPIRRPRVLVVDDSATVRSLVAKALERRSYEPMLASNGMEALARLQEAVPDLILLDVTMPHLDGFKICRVIKENDLTAHVPVIFLSGKDGFLDKVRGRMAGAADYLTKPVSAKTLLEVIDRHCDRWVIDD